MADSLAAAKAELALKANELKSSQEHSDNLRERLSDATRLLKDRDLQVRELQGQLTAAVEGLTAGERALALAVNNNVNDRERESSTSRTLIHTTPMRGKARETENSSGPTRLASLSTPTHAATTAAGFTPTSAALRLARLEAELEAMREREREGEEARHRLRASWEEDTRRAALLADGHAAMRVQLLGMQQQHHSQLLQLQQHEADLERDLRNRLDSASSHIAHLEKELKAAEMQLTSAEQRLLAAAEKERERDQREREGQERCERAEARALALESTEAARNQALEVRRDRTKIHSN